MDETIIILALFVMHLPLYVAIGWLYRHAPVRRVAMEDRELPPLGTHARRTETLKTERVAREARQEAVTAWNEAGKPS